MVRQDALLLDAPKTKSEAQDIDGKVPETLGREYPSAPPASADLVRVVGTDVITEEPYALIGHVRFCEGEACDCGRTSSLLA